ncbi:nuclear transport factor 2 family protein [Asaia krungthepensis]|uniref:SnoaL-like domain-containing protein n=1 Tax=Asaia krungthepensis NRIC 0535 TaxID=1307925 RepID=A0ABQ0Q3F9_9PROT|nr:nuclear transport factor 2 family protein [Asaia krungthepensis]GBQ89447.1 hypothetical protein AA0535_1797 [Asaia krungthepensis NRIC 0535]
MSAASTKLVQQWYATGDTSLLADNVVWTVLDTFPEGGTIIGRDTVATTFFPAVKALFDTYAAVPETCVTEGETVVTTGHYHLMTPGGVRGDIAFAHVWTTGQGKILSFRQVADTAALRALLEAEGRAA